SWPPHCIAGLRGAEPPAALRLPEETHIVYKGTSAYADAYSAFQATGLGVELRRRGCRRVFIGGLATDYCALATALDALRNGLDAVVFEDAVRPVEVPEGDGARALEEMRVAGVKLCSSKCAPA
ncbi:MAG: isochorismatase family protein, partial [Acetobacteraceae bacterium]